MSISDQGATAPADSTVGVARPLWDQSPLPSKERSACLQTRRLAAFHPCLPLILSTFQELQCAYCLLPQGQMGAELGLELTASKILLEKNSLFHFLMFRAFGPF